MQQSPASPRALKGDSPFPKTRLSLAEPMGQAARLGQVALGLPKGLVGSPLCKNLG